MSHTPGPWKAERKNDSMVVIDLPGDGAIQILGYNTEANSILTVAAPKLLKACKRLLMHVGLHGMPAAALEQDAKYARAIIAKTKIRRRMESDE